MAGGRVSGGLTATAVVLTGVLLRSGPGVAPQIVPPAGISTTMTSGQGSAGEGEKAVTGEGPWTASCNYWRPAHGITEGKGGSLAETPDASLVLKVEVKNGKTAASLKTSMKAETKASEESGGKPEIPQKGTRGQGAGETSEESTATPDLDEGCGPNKWGASLEETRAITALVATVMDPVHSSLALEFDRTVDVLMQAAAAHGYVGSYFWLPWRRTDAVKGKEAGHAEETKEDLEREKQPGLLILKRADPFRRDRNGKVIVSDPRVIYLFLVGQTPAVGINGEEMQQALHYEALLRGRGAQLSLHASGEADVIGPNSSGSAASLRMSLQSARIGKGIRTFSVAGITATPLASEVLNEEKPSGGNKVHYLSFGDNARFEQERLVAAFQRPHGDASRMAFLAESGTVLGSATVNKFSVIENANGLGTPLSITYPRELSLLRNAQKDESSASTASADAAAAAASPYLHQSLKDSSVEDTIPHFSEETPFSQESQWMAIVRELRGRHVEVVAITSSNTLDALFLARLLHRDMPDARLMFLDSSDLLFTHYGDNAAYLGSISLTAFPFTKLVTTDMSQHLYNFANGWTEAYFNAASYTFWDGKNLDYLALAGYSHDWQSKVREGPYLWATVVGHDGYYPLAIESACATGRGDILPEVVGPDGPGALVTKSCDPEKKVSLGRIKEDLNADHATFPAFSWYVLCLLLILLCSAHSVALRAAGFWSPVTRDLAVDQGDQPRRRALYLHIAAAMLLSMCLVLTIPLFTTLPLLHPSSMCRLFAALTLLSGTTAMVLTRLKVNRYVRMRKVESEKSQCIVAGSTWSDLITHGDEVKFYSSFNWLATSAVMTVLGFWTYLCWPVTHTFAGLFFGFRCLHPLNGVSPVLPVLLLLLSWYLWATFQTRRLRFSENSRPMLPRNLPEAYLSQELPMYVSDDSLRSYALPSASCLYENITCLFITRQMVRRVVPHGWLNGALGVVYGVLFLGFVFFLPLHSLDHAFRKALPVVHVTGYEFLVSTLFYPLLVIALTGSLRMLVVWSSLRRGLLEPLERSPLRFAFSRLTDAAWTTMLQQGGLVEYWRDLARSMEAMRHISHLEWTAPAGNQGETSGRVKMVVAREEVEKHVTKLRSCIANGDYRAKLRMDLKEVKRKHAMTWEEPARTQLEEEQRALMLKIEWGGEIWTDDGHYLSGVDLPEQKFRHELNLMCAIECGCATYAEGLLSSVLLPYWKNIRKTAVEADAIVAEDARKAEASSAESEPEKVQRAEEYLAIRYVSLIRTILINLRQLMLFVSAAFVLATVAWNCYPFQPQQWIDYAFTALLLVLGAAVVLTFAQMHRDPILSRITGTEANKLDGAFYLRLVTFGAVPLLTWLASQFPAIGGGLSKLLQSGMELAK